MSVQATRVSPALLAAAFVAAGAAGFFHRLQYGAAPQSVSWVDLLSLAAIVLTAALGWRFCAKAQAANQQLSSSEARQRSIVDGAGEAIIVIDDQATIETFNREAERMFGYGAAEIIGTSLERLMTEGARQAHAAYLAETGVTAMVEAVRLRSVHKGVRKQGEVFPFELTMTEWSDGRRRMFPGVMRDVSERERAAAALRESQARYAGLYESSAELLFIYAVESGGGFVLESMNRAAEIYTGFPRSAVAGRTPDEFAAPEEARALKRALLRCLDTGAPVAHEFHLRVKGQPRALQVMISPMRDGSGEITRVLASGRDSAMDAQPEHERAAEAV